MVATFMTPLVWLAMTAAHRSPPSDHVRPGRRRTAVWLSYHHRGGGKSVEYARGIAFAKDHGQARTRRHQRGDFKSGRAKMADDNKRHDWSEEFWYRGKVTRRRLIGYGAASAGALGATMLVPAPWQAAFGQAKPYKIGALQPLSGAGAAGGKTALV